MAHLVTAIGQLLLPALIVGCAPRSGENVARGDAGGSVSAADATAAGSAGAAAHASGDCDTTDGGGGGAAGAAGETTNEGSDSLFDGADLAAWDRYLGKPSDAEPALGLDNDPRGVYSIVTLDSEPAIRISGEVWGSLISKREFCNFRLRAEFKWGSAVWPPLNAKDSGIMFLSTGPLGAVNAGGNALSNPIGSGSFMVASEYQIAHDDVGSLYHLGPIAFTGENLGGHMELLEAWNTVEISVLDDRASLSLNGHETARASGFVLNWPDQPPRSLRCGKLQLQSEGAEIFFRRLQIEELP